MEGRFAAIIFHRTTQRHARTFGDHSTRVISALRNRYMGDGMADNSERRKAYITSSRDFAVCIMAMTNIGAARPTGDR